MDGTIQDDVATAVIWPSACGYRHLFENLMLVWDLRSAERNGRILCVLATNLGHLCSHLGLETVYLYCGLLCPYYVPQEKSV